MLKFGHLDSEAKIGYLMRRMKTNGLSKVQLEKLSNVIGRYEGQWVAVSAANAIVANGNTYGEALSAARAKGESEVVLFKVPPLNYSLALSPT